LDRLLGEVLDAGDCPPVHIDPGVFGTFDRPAAAKIADLVLDCVARGEKRGSGFRGQGSGFRGRGSGGPGGSGIRPSWLRSVMTGTFEGVECSRMLNGMERTLEKQLPESDRRWPPPSVR
jgi:hypothetical protein